MSDRMQMAIEYRDLLREIIELEGKIFGELTDSAAGPEQKEEPDPDPVVEKPEKKTKGGRRIKIDRGKLFALKNAGWSAKKIAEEMGCTEKTVNTIIGNEG